MQVYKDLVRDVLENGKERGDRTGTGTRGVFGRRLEIDVSEKFPLMTHKKMAFRSVVAELIWFLSGSTDNNYLRSLGSTIWDEWATMNGELGPIYGHQWRHFNEPYKEPQIAPSNGYDVYVAPKPRDTSDQIAYVLNRLKNKPSCRRMVVSAWNPLVLPEDGLTTEQNIAKGYQALPPCHMSFQFYVEPGTNKLSLMWTQRSADLGLGVPYNIASYATLLYIMAAITGNVPDRLIGNFGDTHLYLNHIDSGAVDKILNQPTFELPTLELDDMLTNLQYYELPDIDSARFLLNTMFSEEDNAKTYLDSIVNGLTNYQSSPRIKMDVSV